MSLVPRIASQLRSTQYDGESPGLVSPVLATLRPAIGRQLRHAGKDGEPQSRWNGCAKDLSAALWKSLHEARSGDDILQC